MSTELTMIQDYDDGFVDDHEARVIQGEIIKFDPALGMWKHNDAPFPPETELLAVETRKIAQRWENQTPVETIVVRPGTDVDIDELNNQIPQDQWEDGLNGEPRAPWQLNYAVYLLDPHDGGMYTSINSTVGQRTAVRRLKDKVMIVRALRGAKVVPVVTLGSALMKTKYGTKMRPEFDIVDWRELGKQPEVKQTETKQIGAPVKPVSTTELIDDELPF